MVEKVTFFWFRRDLRLDDNVGLYHALKSNFKVVPLFIFDDEILDKLPEDDARVGFIYSTLEDISKKLREYDSSLLIKKGNPLEIWKNLTSEFSIQEVYCNHDYEPYAISRDKKVHDFLAEKNIKFKTFKDQVIFEKEEVLKDNGAPYTVYTPYKNKWLQNFQLNQDTKEYSTEKMFDNFFKSSFDFPALRAFGFSKSSIMVRPYDFSMLSTYGETRDFPAIDGTSSVSPYLRFGLLSIRKLVKRAKETNAIYLSELIWREFFMQILFHFPQVVTESFRPKYDAIKWRNNKDEFEKWCLGTTGYPLVDAGMRELNQTGYMHNRVRMVVASFLCKHLLIDWRWGEAYFAEKLLDYELSSNNGNWQWAAGTGCDAAPYFRVFNPSEQLKKFDKDLKYTSKWVPEFHELTYAQPIVDHKLARERALATYKEALK